MNRSEIKIPKMLNFLCFVYDRKQDIMKVLQRVAHGPASTFIQSLSEGPHRTEI